MKEILLSLLTSISFFIQAQNVGINNTNPQYSLDVDGHINTSGTIIANGDKGKAGQMLVKDSENNLAWSDQCEFKNMKNFEFTTFDEIQNFIVPDGVTKIKIKAWGGGGKGYSGVSENGGGGGGGGYIEGIENVTSGSNLQVRVGNGGSAAFGSSGYSSVQNSSLWSFYAYGGQNSSLNATTQWIDLGVGGSYSAFNTTSYIGMIGESGKPATFRYEQISSTEFAKAKYDGNGGNAGNTNSTGGTGGFAMKNTTTGAILFEVIGSKGNVPGGGASSNPFNNNAGNGRVIIYW